MNPKRRAKGVLSVVKQAASEFSDDDAMSHGAALAFYTALSLAPLLLLLVWIGGMLGPETEQQLIEQLVGLIGPQGAETIKMILDGAEEPSLGNLAGIAGFGTLLLSATGVFGQLQHALNVIWDVEPKPKQGVWGLIRKRLLSLGMVLTIGFLLMVSMAASAALSAVINLMQGVLPGTELVWRLADIALSVLLFAVGFGTIYKLLPDVKIAWRDVWFGGFVTAALFTAGKVLIGLYLGNSSVGSAYGAAGSLIVLLVWVYYSSLIIFFGAELTQVWALRRGSGLEPDKHAVWRDHTKAKRVVTEAEVGWVTDRKGA